MAETINQRGGPRSSRNLLDGPFPVPSWMNPTSVELFEAKRKEALEYMRNAITERLACVFADAHPHFHEMHLLHPNPVEARSLASLSLQVRKLGWIGAQWIATVEGLDNTDLKQYAWVFYIHDTRFLDYDEAWDTSRPFRTPEGIPITAPSSEQHEQWQPETNFWDVQDAARHELEINAGGLMTALLRSMWAEDNPNRMAANAAVALVHSYLSYYLASTSPLPDDIYNPIYWGHDARMKTLKLAELQVNGNPIILTPEFDPEILEYSASQPLVNYQFLNGDKPTFFDPLMSYSKNVTQTWEATNQANDTLVFTVIAKDGTSKRVYKIVTS